MWVNFGEDLELKIYIINIIQYVIGISGENMEFPRAVFVFSINLLRRGGFTLVFGGRGSSRCVRRVRFDHSNRILKQEACALFRFLRPVGDNSFQQVLVEI